MAQPVPLKLVRPHAAPDEHADAVQAAYALLDELHDAGVLDLLRGLAGAGGDIATRLSEAANTPEAIAALRNAISLMKILGGIDPAILQGVANILTQPRRTLSAAAYGLQVFGRVLLSRW
jgi:uncharacterized protein YjgD (DUF1641 family)